LGYIRPLSDRVAWIARGQHGRVTRTQLIAAGLDADRIKRWIAAGRLRRVHHGVYAVGHEAPSTHAHYMAAVLASGAGAVLSHRSAAHLLRLIAGPPPRPEVTIPVTAGRTRPGVVVHRSTFHPLDVSTLDGIPITTVPRILLDLAPTTAPAQLTRLCHEAWVRHECGRDQVEACIARNPTKKGATKLRRALGSDVTLSVLEDAFLELLRAYGLLLPRTNIDHLGDKVDCHWPQFGLTIELVSYRFHGSRAAFEQDVARRRRSNHLAYTYGDVFERPAQTIADLRARLRRPPASAGRNTQRACE
jgi:hypothetical protein